MIMMYDAMMRESPLVVFYEGESAYDALFTRNGATWAITANLGTGCVPPTSIGQ